MPTYSPTQARAEIQNLVEAFARNESALHHAPEAQIENDFLRPLFRYLNWNVDNVGLRNSYEMGQPPVLKLHIITTNCTLTKQSTLLYHQLEKNVKFLGTTSQSKFLID